MKNLTPIFLVYLYTEIFVPIIINLCRQNWKSVLVYVKAILIHSHLWRVFLDIPATEFSRVKDE